ncbi:MAG: cell wall hydrolase [Hyphomonadaceae bacterium]|nr:cell wall hydrolase [Hyphomonadaceae bacterium]
MTFRLFWRRLAIFAGELRTQVMVEIERNPLAVRQGAATVMCLAAAAVAMPVISYRAAEQREGAEWAATSGAFRAELQDELLAVEPAAHVELTSFRTGDGLRARGSAALFENADARAMMVQAVLRGPSSPTPETPVEPQIDSRQHNCLSQAIYYEARGETQRGQVAVAEVIMNRVRSRHYPNSVCGVVYQGSHLSTGCQFTFTCDGSIHQRPRGRAWDRAQRVATAVMLGYTRPLTQGATHYHTHAVNPVWNSGLVETVNIGSHVFYRMPNRAERAYYQEALARRRGSYRAAGIDAPDDAGDVAPVVEETRRADEQPAPAQEAAPVEPSVAPDVDQPIETNSGEEEIAT